MIEKSFELTAETKHGGTVTNVKRKRVPGGGSSYSKTMRTKACADCGHVGQPIKAKVKLTVGVIT